MRKSATSVSALWIIVVVAITLSQVSVFAVSSDPFPSPHEKSQSAVVTRKKKKKKRSAQVLLPVPLGGPTTALNNTVPQRVIAPTGGPIVRQGSRMARTPGLHVFPAAQRTTGVPLASFSNTSAITIDPVNADTEPQPGLPYPSEIDVFGLTGSVGTVSVTLNGLNHDSVDDLDMLLVAPNGQAFHFWSDVGGANAVSELTVTVADNGATPLPDAGPLVTGTTYKPFNADTVGDTFPNPAPTTISEPAPAGNATFTSVFGGLTATQATGTWSLYVTDDTDGNGGIISGGWSLDISEFNPPTTAGQLVISEFRLRGINGASDEFVELYNTTGDSLLVQAADASSGLALAASDGIARCVVPNGTVIPAAGHFLCVNSVGYGYGTYPAGEGATATGDLTYTTDIPDNAGIALFNNATGGASFSLANRIDAVGSTSEANTLYKEGTGYPALTPFSINYSFYRDLCGKGGSITQMGPCPMNGGVKDTGNNAADFVFVDSNGTSAGAGQRLGAPGPENLTSPTQNNAGVVASLIVPCVAASAAPNRVRDFTSDPANNSTFGTLSIRRRFTNQTGQNVSRLRFRIVDITTFPAPGGIADLRVRSSSNTKEISPECNGGTSIDLIGLTLEQASAPENQPNGGAFNSSLGVGTITLASPLAINGTIDVDFLLGIQQTGNFKFYVNVEAVESAPTPEHPVRRH